MGTATATKRDMTNKQFGDALRKRGWSLPDGPLMYVDLGGAWVSCFNAQSTRLRDVLAWLIQEHRRLVASGKISE